MDEYQLALSPQELREFWADYELWLDMVELSLPLPMPQTEEEANGVDFSE